MGPTTTSDETSAVGSSLVAKTPKAASVVVEKQPVENAITQQGPPPPQQTAPPAPQQTAQQGPLLLNNRLRQFFCKVFGIHR